ncbi:MAG: hypothetical protein FJ030_18135 [Chloroflexi bacterium]|nr:hypothetical protein [Chloroflexota bacterium]
MDTQDLSSDFQPAAPPSADEKLSPSGVAAIQGEAEPAPADRESIKRAVAAGAAGAVILASGLTLLDRVDFRQTESAPPPEETQQNVVIETPSQQAQFHLPAEGELSVEYHLDLPDAEPAQASPAAEVNLDQRIETPLKSQRDLTYNGQPTQYGCVPTSVSMITDYWNRRDSTNPTKSAQEFLDLNAAQKQFDGGGMSATNIHDELSNMGYAAGDRANASFDDLRNATQEGPVLAIVKLGMKESGPNHAVVVTDVSESGEVAVNDPWTGEARTYGREQFSASWGANFGKGASTNNFVTIRPAQK